VLNSLRDAPGRAWPLWDTAPVDSSRPDTLHLVDLSAGEFADAPAGTPHRWGRVVDEVGNVDRNIYRAVAATPTPTIDAAMRRLSMSADHGALWFGLAGALALFGGRRGRQAGLEGVASLISASAVANLALKPVLRRERPDRELHQVDVARHVPLPTSTSFPSGHSASAFAFANGASAAMPELGLPLRLLAAAVGWSRVHTGVHYPGDVLTGAIVGSSCAEVTVALQRRYQRHREERR